jgi:hypothetical protein
VVCPLSVTTTSLPSATLGARYSVPLLAVGGGTPQYTWSVSDRWLPPGLSLSPAGLISGSPAPACTVTPPVYTVAKMVDFRDVSA